MVWPIDGMGHVFIVIRMAIGRGNPLIRDVCFVEIKVMYSLIVCSGKRLGVPEKLVCFVERTFIS